MPCAHGSPIVHRSPPRDRDKLQETDAAGPPRRILGSRTDNIPAQPVSPEPVLGPAPVLILLDAVAETSLTRYQTGSCSVFDSALPAGADSGHGAVPE